MAKIKLTRFPEKANSGNEILVYLDGVYVAQVANGCTLEIDVSPGSHFVRLSAASQGSKKHYFDIQDGETKTLLLSTNENASRLGAFGTSGIVLDLIVNGFMLLYYFTIGQNRYLQVTELNKDFR